MRKKIELEDHTSTTSLEIHKAVAQALHSISSTSKPANEFDAQLREFKPEPSRFKIQAMKMKKKKKILATNYFESSSSTTAKWDFKKSLWDSYEIVTISKRLELGLVLDDKAFDEESKFSDKVIKKRRESMQSLRNLFNMSSRRFNEPEKKPQEK